MSSYMEKPIVSSVNAFDATEAHTFYFTVNGGNQVVKNTIEILTNTETNPTVVYTKTVETFQFNQTVPSGTLTNGESYLVTFKTYDANGNSSEWGTTIPFYCFTKPTLTYSPSENSTVNNSYVNLSCRYSQSQNENINYMYFLLYNSSNSELARSSNIYNKTFATFSYDGLEDNQSYKFKVVCVTEFGTIVETDLINFNVIYNTPKLYSKLTLTPNCNGGYINISSSLIAINGISNPTDATYVENNSAVDLIGCCTNIKNKYNKYIKWTDGFKIPRSGFTLRCWFTPSEYDNNLNNRPLLTFGDNAIYLCKKNNNKYLLAMKYSGGIISNLIYMSNELDYIDENGKYFMWLEFNPNAIDGEFYKLIIEELDGNEVTPSIEWNGTTNQTYNYTTNNLVYEIESSDITSKSNSPIKMPLYSDCYDICISNGIYRHLNITSEVDMEYSTEIPSWDINTIFDCNFNKNLNGGNIEELYRTINSLVVKRRDENTLNWIKIYEQRFTDLNNSINITDSYIPSGITQEYAIVPILVDGTEGNYITETVTPKWNQTFISDSSGKIFKLYSGVTYGGTTANSPKGILSPIGTRYPIVIRNSNNNYKNGNISGNLFGYNFDTTRAIDRQDVVKQSNDFIEFLNNGLSKVVTDWNGNIFVFQVSSNPTLSYNQSYGNGFATISFDWVEQGRYNNVQEMYDCGLLKYI